jgi:LysR family glycine cleavage system transcriptional activator
MAGKRYRLPPLNVISGFEAAARNLSFTKAADELFITQSAVSKQVKTLEEHLGVALFERRTRELVLTAAGQQLYRTATELLNRLQEETDKLKSGGKVQQVSVTASPGFTSLWLIPRLKRFRLKHPDIDVRIAATVDILQLERKRLDVAIRYCRSEAAPKGAVRLFDYAAFPVCSPSLARDRSKPLVKPQDLRAHVLLHETYVTAQKAYVDWDAWFAAADLQDLQPAGALYFNHYDQMIQAAIQGQGVALASALSCRSCCTADRWSHCSRPRSVTHGHASSSDRRSPPASRTSIRSSTGFWMKPSAIPRARRLRCGRPEARDDRWRRRAR